MSSYKILGEDIQYIEFLLNPGESLHAEAGAMLFRTPLIKMETQAKGGLGGVFKRLITGESLFIPTFTNTANVEQTISFAAPYPGRIVPVNLPDFGGTLLCQSSSYLVSDTSISVEIAFTKKIGAGLFGGEGFILQKLQGNGLAFIHAGGMIIEKNLVPGEKLLIDTGCIVAFQESVHYNIEFIGGIKNTIFGGEGLFQATLTGPGKIFLQSLPFSRLADSILSATHMSGDSKTGVAGVAGDIFGGLLQGGR